MMMTHDAMVKRFKYLSNTTTTAIKKGYPKKEIRCGRCGQVIQESELDGCGDDAIEYVETKRKDEFFYHHKCILGGF